MKCRKCGAEVAENDVFCGNCGTKLADDISIEDVQNVNDLDQRMPDNEGKTGKKSNKVKIIIGIIAVVLVAIAVLFYIGSRPEDIDIEADELGSILYTDEEEQYYGDNLHVHGYFFRYIDSDGQENYVLVSDKENMTDAEGVMFVYDEGMAEDIGNGSELIVTGKIGNPKDSPSLRILLAESIEVVNKTERTYVFDTVRDLLDAQDKYLDKKVSVSGIVDCASYEIVFIEDEIDDAANGQYVLLRDTDDTYVIYDKPFGYYTVTGTYVQYKGNPAIIVDDIELIMELDSYADDEITEFDSAKELTAVADQYDGRSVTVTGWIEVAGASGYIMGGDCPIELTGVTEEEVMALYGGYSKITGVFTDNRGGDGAAYYLHVEKIGD